MERMLNGIDMRVPDSLTGLAPTGSDDTSNTQGLLNLTGKVKLQGGTFTYSNMLQVKTGSCVSGGGMGVTTMKMASGSWSGVTQVNSINGVGLIITEGNTTASYISIRDLTIDGNQTGITALPSWATNGTAAGDNVTNSPLHLNDVTHLEISGVEVINSIGYAVYLQSCSQLTVKDCRVVSGQTSATQGWGLPSQQDGLHMDGCTYWEISDCYVDTGTSTTDVGDDTIALQSLSGAVHDGTIKGCILRSAEAAVDFALSGNAIYNVAITDNDIWTTENDGVAVEPFVAGASLAYNVTVTGNTFNSVSSLSGSTAGVLALYDYTRVSSSGASWANFTFSGNSVYGGGGNASMLGVYAQQGTGLTVSGNAFYDFPGTTAIAVGDNNKPVTNFTVTGNQIYCTASGAQAVQVEDSSYGSVSGNVGWGNFGFGSAGCRIIGTTVAPVGIAVSGNQFANFGDGIIETNNGAQPDYNTITGNNLYGIYSGATSGGVSPSGAHTLAAANSSGSGIGRTTLTTAFNSGTGTSAQNVTGMSVALPVGAYEIRAYVPMSPHGTTGSTQKLAWTFSGTASAGSVAWQIAGTSLTGGGGTSITAASAVSATMTSAGMVGTCIGQVTVSAAGTLQLTVTSGTSGDECTIPVGAYIDVQPVAT